MLSRMANNLEHVTESVESSYTELFTDTDSRLDFIPTSALREDGTMRTTEIGDVEVTQNARMMLRIATYGNLDNSARQLITATVQLLRDRYLNVQTVSDLIVPMLSANTAGRERLEEVPQRWRSSDSKPPTPKRRSDITSISQDIRKHPEYLVGTYFKHRRYGYEGLIVGWDPKCENDEAWIQQMRVDSLPRGRSQPFYSVIDVGGGSRYVAEENITPLGLSEFNQVVPHRNLLRRAGEFMKRWDPRVGRFVSNIVEEYPED